MASLTWFRHLMTLYNSKINNTFSESVFYKLLCEEKNKITGTFVD